MTCGELINFDCITFWRISLQLEHANERYKLLESSSGSYKREAEALRDKSHKLSVTCAKLETSYEAARQELSEVKEKLLKSEVPCYYFVLYDIFCTSMFRGFENLFPGPQVFVRFCLVSSLLVFWEIYSILPKKCRLVRNNDLCSKEP